MSLTLFSIPVARITMLERGARRVGVGRNKAWLRRRLHAALVRQHERERAEQAGEDADMGAADGL